MLTAAIMIQSDYMKFICKQILVNIIIVNKQMILV